MTTLQTEVLVVGGGATGAGIAWDAALRGYDAILVDRADLAEGTSGRFHGLLHSGGRYVVKDPIARARVRGGERDRPRRSPSAAIEDTGGLFVTTPDDDPAYGDQFLAGCAEAGRADGGDRRRRGAAPRAAAQPGHQARVHRRRRVGRRVEAPRGRSPTAPPARRAHPPLPPLRRAPPRRRRRHRRAPARRAHAARRSRSRPRFTINAGGAWAGTRSRDMAGIEGVSVVPGKGIMIAMNHRLVNTVVNRCTMPADGDIIVPIRTVSVIGTTDIRSEHPDDLPVTQDEVDAMLADGERLVPGFRNHRALRVWAGRAPALRRREGGRGRLDARRQPRHRAARPRRARRRQRLHHDHRRQADDLPAHGRGGRRRDGRAARPRPAVHDEDDRAARLGGRRVHVAGHPPARARAAICKTEQLICECELIERSTPRGGDAARAARRTSTTSAAACGWAWARARAASASRAPPGSSTRSTGSTAAEANTSMRSFLQERWKGV